MATAQEVRDAFQAFFGEDVLPTLNLVKTNSDAIIAKLEAIESGDPNLKGALDDLQTMRDAFDARAKEINDEVANAVTPPPPPPPTQVGDGTATPVEDVPQADPTAVTSPVNPPEQDGA